MNSKKFAARQQQKNASLRLGYEILEPRHLLAVTLGPEPVSVYQAQPTAISKANLDVQFNSTTDATPGSDLIVNLATTIPVEQRNELLRDHLNMGQFDTLWLSSLQRDQLGTAHLNYQQFHRGFAVEGGEYTVHVEDRQVFRLSGNYVDIGTPTFSVKLTEST